MQHTTLGLPDGVETSQPGGRALMLDGKIERLYVRATANGDIHRRYRIVESGEWVPLNPGHNDFADADTIMDDADLASLTGANPGVFCSWCFPRDYRWLFIGGGNPMWREGEPLAAESARAFAMEGFASMWREGDTSPE